MADIPAIAAGSFLQARALKAKAENDKNIAEANAELSTFKAEDALLRGKEKEQEFRKKVKQTVGAQRAALAAAGVDVGSGTALDIQESTRDVGELDALTIRNNARREAFGYKVEAINFRTQGAIAFSTQRAQAASTLLTGGLKIFGGGLSAGAGKSGFSGS